MNGLRDLVDFFPLHLELQGALQVWVHGYNVNPNEAMATFAEVFKRFFHAGYEGRFLGVSWYGDPPANFGGTAHYHQAVVNAFATAGAFAEFINNLEPPVAIAAHSLGNMLVGEAIESHQLVFDKYFAIDAAVALEAYGQVAKDEGMLRVDNWLDYWNHETTDTNDTPFKARN